MEYGIKTLQGHKTFPVDYATWKREEAWENEILKSLSWNSPEILWLPLNKMFPFSTGNWSLDVIKNQSLSMREVELQSFYSAILIPSPQSSWRLEVSSVCQHGQVLVRALFLLCLHVAERKPIHRTFWIYSIVLWHEKLM